MTRILALVAFGALLFAVPAVGQRAIAGRSGVASLANGGFEHGLAGWTVVGEADPCPWTTIVSGTQSFVCHAGYGFAEPAPVGGLAYASTDFDRSSAAAPEKAMLSQRLSIAGHGRTILHWSDYLSWDLVTYGATKPRLVSVQIRSADGSRVLSTVYQRRIEPGTVDFGAGGWHVHAANISRYAGRDVTLAFVLSMPEVLAGPAVYSIDAVGLDSRLR